MKILITGGTSALGAELTQLLASQGHQLIITYCRNSELARDLCSRYDSVQKRQVDFTLPASVQALVQEIPALDIDVLVNNAYLGQPLGTHFHRTSIDDFEQAFDHNVKPVILISQACIAMMRRRKAGLLVTIGSLATTATPPGYGVYAATKAYLQQLARSWHNEYAHLGIRSVAVLPDFMPTPLHGEMLEHLAQSELERKGRLLEPKQVAQEVADIINGVAPFNQQHIITVKN